LYEALLDEGMRDYFDQMDRYFRMLIAASPRAHYVLSVPMTFPASQMQGGDHVNAAGASAYTARLVELVGMR
jgi:hypothetical protein